MDTYSYSRLILRPSIGLLSAVLLVLGPACRSVDVDAPAREALARAEHESSAAAYQAFLDTRPNQGLFAEGIERAEAIIAQEERGRLLALDLPEQVKYLRQPGNRFARGEVLASAFARVHDLPRIEQIQWAVELLGPCRTGSDESMRSLRSIFVPPGASAPREELPEFGPADMTGLERARYAVRLSRQKFFEPWERENAIAFLLAISTDRSGYRWVQVGMEFVPSVKGTPTTPRKEAIRALDKIVGPRELPGLAASKGTLTRERAWSIVEAWLEPENNYLGRRHLYPAILQIQGRGIEECALELAEQHEWPNRLPALLEAVWRRLPGVEERIPTWLNSDSWEDQTAAAYALALYGLPQAGLDARLTELENSDRRMVRSAVALVRSGLALEAPSSSESAAALQASVDGGGVASAKRFLELSARGFLKSSDSSYVDLEQPLPDLDLSEASPFRVLFSVISSYGTYPTREESFAALESHYSRLQHAQSPKASTLAIRRSYDESENDKVVACILTLAALEKEAELLLDPEVDGRWLCWPDVYYCFLDTERDVVLGTYTGLFEDRLLPVPPDVAQAAREVFAVTGIHEEYSGAEGGLILVVPPDFLKNRGRYSYNLLKENRTQLRDAVGPIRGRTLVPWETRWVWVMNTMRKLWPGDPHQAAHLIHTMAAGLPDADFPSELVFASSDGEVVEVEQQETPAYQRAGLHLAVRGNGGTDDYENLHVVGVEVGARVKRGQWIGFRRCH